MQPPKTWGSHASRLAEVVLRGPRQDPEIDAKVKLDPESFDRIVTWIDINAPYYPDYAGGAYRDNLYGRSPLDRPAAGATEPADRHEAGRPAVRREVNFTRPELSPCLAQFADKSDPQYREALAIIAGRRG